MADLTNSKPKDTYQRLVQIESDETNRFKRFQDGLGNSISTASFDSLEVLNDIVVRSGSVFAQSFVTTYTTSSTLYQSGSTKFGDGLEDKHEFTGSVDIANSLSVTGSVTHIGTHTQTGDSTLTGNTVRLGDTTLTGELTHSGSISLNSIGNVRLTGNITHIGDTTQTGDTSIIGDTTLTGGLTHSGSINLNSIGDVRLTGNITQIGNVVQTGDSNISGDLVVGGTVTAQEFRTELVTSATIFESGSTQFGDTLDDTHKFTGSLDITGSLDVDERLTARSVSSEFFMSPKTVGDMVVPANYNIRLFHDTEITGELFVGQNSDVYVVKYATTD